MISHKRVPEPADRGALEKRLAYLRASLNPAGQAFAAQRVLQLFHRYPAVVAAPDVSGLVTAYAMDLGRFPDWAIDEAIGRVIDGRGYGNGAFAPSSTELVRLCLEQLARVETEIRGLRRVLEAQVYIEQAKEQREAMRGRFAALLQDLGDANRRDPLNKGKPVLPTRREAEANLEVMAEGLPQIPVRLSDEAVQKFYRPR